MKFIGFGIISYTIIYPLLFPLSFVVRGIVRTQFKDYQFNYIMNSLFMFIAELLLGLINICYQCFNKDKKEEEKDANFDSSVLTGDLFLFLNKENEQKEEELSTVKMIGICSLLGFIDFLSFSLPMLKTSEAILYLQLSNETIFIKIVIIGLLCKYVLEYKLQRHQIVSIVVILVGTIINIVALFIIKSEDIVSVMLAFLLFFFCFFLQSIQIVIEKYLYVKYRKTPYDTLLYEGLFGVLFIMCFAAFLCVYPCPNFMKDCDKGKNFNFFVEFSEQFKKKAYFSYIPLYFLSSAGINYLSRQSTYYYTPTTDTISDSLGGFLFYIYIRNFIATKDQDKFALSNYLIIGYIVVVIGCFVYNEILIIYGCGMEVDTVREVTKRAGQDYELFMKKVEPNILTFLVSSKY